MRISFVALPTAADCRRACVLRGFCRWSVARENHNNTPFIYAKAKHSFAQLFFFRISIVDASIHREKRFAYFYWFRTFYGAVCVRYACTHIQWNRIIAANGLSCRRRRNEFNYGFYYSKWSDECANGISVVRLSRQKSKTDGARQYDWVLNFDTLSLIYGIARATISESPDVLPSPPIQLHTHIPLVPLTEISTNYSMLIENENVTGNIGRVYALALIHFKWPFDQWRSIENAFKWSHDYRSISNWTSITFRNKFLNVNAAVIFTNCWSMVECKTIIIIIYFIF